MENKEKVFLGIYSEERVLMTNELAVLLSKILNTIHNTNFSERFWKIILRSYISAIISDRVILSKDLITKDVPSDVFANTLFPDKSTVYYGTLRYNAKSIKSLFTNSDGSNIENHTNIGLGFHDKESFVENVDYFFETQYPLIFPKRINHRKRNIEVDCFTNEKYNLIFIKNITRHLPKVYVEHFFDLYNSIKVINPQNKIIHVSFLENFYMSLLLAKYVEGGAKLYSYQHGAFYGEFPFHSSHHFESSVSDKFLTWGWKMLPNDFPLFAFRLGKIKRAYQHVEQKEIDLLLMFPALNGRNDKTLIDRSTFLIDHINRDLYKNIIARPRPEPKINRKKALNFLPKSVTIDSGYSELFKLISNSKIVIQISIPSTNFLECLAINHPTIGVLDNDDPSETIKPHYDYLLSVGILHKDVHSLITHLNTVDLPKWWADTILSPGYISFKREFLNLKKN